MAKKKKETIEEPIVEETVVMEEPVVETPKIKEVKPEPKEEKWVVKDRTYWLTRKRRPLSYMIRTANIHWFDEEKGYERELKYCSNQ